MNIQYPIDEVCQGKHQVNSTGVKYRVSGNLFIAKQVSSSIPKSFHGSRCAITAFSDGSAVRMRRYLRECRADYQYMVTLTYPCGFESDGSISKNHLRRFLQEVQRDFKRGSGTITANIRSKPQRLSLFWFLEFQERGAPHYHILSTHRIDKDWVSRRWYDIVNSEDKRHLYAGTRCESLRCGRAGTVKYAIKYANKQAQKVVPKDYENVGRFWGVYGDRWCVSADITVSDMDSKHPDLYRPMKGLERCVEKHKSAGLLKVFKRDTGVFLATTESRMVRAEITMWIHAIGAALCSHDDRFMTAEICKDENYNDDQML